VGALIDGCIGKRVRGLAEKRDGINSRLVFANWIELERNQCPLAIG